LTDTLMPQARRLLADQGAVPPRNEIMKHFGISGPRATAIRDELIREDARASALADQAVKPSRRRPTRAHRRPLPPRLRKVGTARSEQAPPTVVVPAVEVHVPAPPAPRWRATGAQPRRLPRRRPKVSTPAQPAAATPPAAATAPQVTAQIPDPAPAPQGEHQPPAKRRRPLRAWPVLVLALPASIAIWAGWVGIGGLTGFGSINLLPGIAPANGWATIDTAITLPIGMEAYAAFALRVWLSGQVPPRARRFAKWSAISSLALGAAGQVAYHLMVAAGVTAAPWPITTALSCIPVAVLGMGAALYHLIRDGQEA
jgi:hypothetical protein